MLHFFLDIFVDILCKKKKGILLTLILGTIGMYQCVLDNVSNAYAAHPRVIKVRELRTQRAAIILEKKLVAQLRPRD